MKKIINLGYYNRLKGGKEMNTCKNAEEKAIALLKEKDAFQIPVDPVELAEKLGIKVYNIEFDNSNISGVISKQNEDVFILTNENECYNRIRFTVAHELGHFILHMTDNNKTIEEFYRGNENSQQEVEANNFAAALLMPCECVKEQFKNLDDMLIEDNIKVNMLAQMFKVSEIAMSYRLSNLGLIG